MSVNRNQPLTEIFRRNRRNIVKGIAQMAAGAGALYVRGRIAEELGIFTRTEPVFKYLQYNHVPLNDLHDAALWLDPQLQWVNSQIINSTNYNFNNFSANDSAASYPYRYKNISDGVKLISPLFKQIAEDISHMQNETVTYSSTAPVRRPDGSEDFYTSIATFVAIINYDSSQLSKLYPGWEDSIDFPMIDTPPGKTLTSDLEALSSMVSYNRSNNVSFEQSSADQRTFAEFVSKLKSFADDCTQALAVTANNNRSGLGI